MKIPGFTAEATLYTKKAIYWTSYTDLLPGGVVEPAFFRCWGNVCCDEWGYCIYKGHVLM